jgi:alkaline phosphatase
MSTHPHGSAYDPAAAAADFDYVNSGYTDSAPAATTMSTGVKTYDGAIGVGPDRQPLVHAIQVAETLGKATGVVTSVEWTHATPAGFVAHNESRNNYEAIGREMVLQSRVDVIMGCGHPWFDNDGRSVNTANSYRYVGGSSLWADLQAGTAGGDADGDGDPDPWTLVETREAFQALASGHTPRRVLGTAQVHLTLQQARSGTGTADPYVVPSTATVPTLAEMTAAALNVLDDDRDGLYLMVEGGAVDWAAHANQSGRLIEEQADFNAAVEVVLEWVHRKGNWADTIVLVTGDHETGYLTRPGVGAMTDSPEKAAAAYDRLVDNGRGVLPGMEWNSASHTNRLIPFFARGRGHERFRRTIVGWDRYRGLYIDNTAVGRVLHELLAMGSR